MAARMYVISEHIVPAMSNSIKVIFIHLFPHTEYTEDQQALIVFIFVLRKVQLFSHLTPQLHHEWLIVMNYTTQLCN